jgi:polyisoprenoid-binding protein YceI
MNFRRPAALISAAFAAVVVVGAASFALRPAATPSAPLESVALAAPLSSSGTLYELTASEASFEVDEVLRGSPFTVVGTTDQVAGQLALDSSNLDGTIVINARTLQTDDSSRDRALANFILDTSSHEYITFAPGDASGMPEAFVPGQVYTFDLTGDLTIKGTTRPATFSVSVTPAADGQLEGTATSTINYADWGVSIPSVPFVASVDQDVTVQLAFSAVAAA